MCSWSHLPVCALPADRQHAPLGPLGKGAVTVFRTQLHSSGQQGERGYLVLAEKFDTHLNGVVFMKFQY